MNFADISDEATAREQEMIAIALANRPVPEPASSICLNGDCGESSQPGTSFCCPECREDAEKWQWAQRQRAIN